MDPFDSPAPLTAHSGVARPRAHGIGFPIGVPIGGSFVLLLWLGFCSESQPADYAVLQPAAFTRHVERFNAMDGEVVVNEIANKAAPDWLKQNIPLFECPDRAVEEIYYFRWWSFRKHLVRTPVGFVITEFLTPVTHAGKFNTISCAAGFHVAEGRWLRIERYVADYIRFWLRGNGGAPQPHFHRYSSWLAAAAWNRYLVNGDREFVVNLLPDLVTDYRVWERERRLTNGSFWQFDVRDGMEESISGSRTRRNVRPTINSYMFTYTRSQHADGKPYIGEYLDEVTGNWINGRNDRSRYYNHSTNADLLISGVVGLRPRADDIVEIDPLLPREAWGWFCLEGVRYHGRLLTVIWDRDGSRYHGGAGLRLLADGKVIARADRLERLTGRLP